MGKSRTWRPFEEARECVRALGLKNRIDGKHIVHQNRNLITSLLIRTKSIKMNLKELGIGWVQELKV